MKPFIVGLLVADAVLAALLGVSYLTLGKGLTPAISWPLAGVFTLLATWVALSDKNASSPPQIVKITHLPLDWRTSK